MTTSAFLSENGISTPIGTQQRNQHMQDYSDPSSSDADADGDGETSPTKLSEFNRPPLSADPSIVAVHGSVPPTPIMGTNEAYFLPPPRVRAHGRTPSQEWDSRRGTLQPGRVAGLKEQIQEAEEQVQKRTPGSGPSPNAEAEVEQGSGSDSGFEPAAKDLAVRARQRRVIGLDFDDVCAFTQAAMIALHNQFYGSDLTIDDMETYYFFQNRGWGTHAEVGRKLRTLRGKSLSVATPVPGFAEGIRQLHALGHPIHIITARPPDDREGVIAWLKEHGLTVGFGDEDAIAALWFTSAFSAANDPGDEAPIDTASGVERENDLNESLREAFKLGANGSGSKKLNVLRGVNAELMIDDHHGNLTPILQADPPIPCLLFGGYKWNAHQSGASTPVELMSFEERKKSGETLAKQQVELVEGLHRAETWKDIVAWVKRWDEGEM